MAIMTLNIARNLMVVTAKKNFLQVNRLELSFTIAIFSKLCVCDIACVKCIYDLV